MHHPKRGDIRVVGQPVTLSRTPASIISTLPELGSHTDEILRSVGYNDVEISDFHAHKIV
jgi:crotonobetainyl-CoA:carnitine CoA-transferase CaiB-like acyl-CoA transferase